MKQIINPPFAFHFFKNFVKNKKVLLITHYDADGIISAALMSLLLDRYTKSYSIITLQSLESGEDIESIFNYKNYDCFIFTDLGLSSLDVLFKTVKKTKSPIPYCIIDHHSDDKTPFYKNTDSSFVMGYSKTRRGDYIISQTSDENTISAGGLVALLLVELNKKLNFLTEEQLEKVCLLGMTSCFSDVIITRQINEWIEPLFKQIDYLFFEDLAVYGYSKTQLKYLLKNIGVPTNGLDKNILNKTYLSLTQLERHKLVNHIVKHCGKSFFDELLGLCCLISIGDDIYEIREFGSFINSLGRQNESPTAIDFLRSFVLGEDYLEKYKKCLEIQKKHKQDLRMAIVKSKDEVTIVDGDILVYHSTASDKIVGSVLGVILQSNNCTYGIGYAKDEDGMLKLSCRSRDESIDIPKMMIEEGIDIKGHSTACGGKIHPEDAAKVVSIFISKVLEHKKKIKKLDELV